VNFLKSLSRQGGKAYVSQLLPLVFHWDDVVLASSIDTSRARLPHHSIGDPNINGVKDW